MFNKDIYLFTYIYFYFLFFLNAKILNFREIGELEIQLRTLESQQEKLQGESSSLKSHLATLNRFCFSLCLKPIAAALLSIWLHCKCSTQVTITKLDYYNQHSCLEEQQTMQHCSLPVRTALLIIITCLLAFLALLTS